MAANTNSGIFGAISRRIFGSHPVDVAEEYDNSAPPTPPRASTPCEEDPGVPEEKPKDVEGKGEKTTASATSAGGRPPGKLLESRASSNESELSLRHNLSSAPADDDVISLDGGISGDALRQGSTRQSMDSVTFRPIAEEPGAESLDTLPGDSAADYTSDTTSTAAIPSLSEGLSSYPVEMSPSMDTTPNRSYVNSPSGLRGTPQGASQQGSMGLTPRSLQVALEASRDFPKDKGASPFSREGPAPGLQEQGVDVEAMPVEVSPIRTKLDIGQRTASPTTDIVDDLLGEVVHGRLTKDSLPPTSRRELDLGQEQQEIVPGEASGELKLLSPGEEPVTVTAPKKEPATEMPPTTSVTGPPQNPAGQVAAQQPPGFGESRSEVERDVEGAYRTAPDGSASPWQEAKEAGVKPLLRSQDKAQLLVGDKPGDFTIVTEEGADIPISAEEIKAITPPERIPSAASSLAASASDSIRTLNSEVDNVPGVQAIRPGVVRTGLGSGSADLEAAEAGNSPVASPAYASGTGLAVDGGSPSHPAGTPTTSTRKRGREAGGPFTLEGPPTGAPKTSEAALSPGIAPSFSGDISPDSMSDLPINLTLTGMAVGSGPDRASLDGSQRPSAAEQRIFTGAPVGHPSGATTGLTPSEDQVAEARSLAGGKVDPVTGHSTLSATELGLPESSGELLDLAAPAASSPQPVGAYSSSVAVKPVSATTTDVSSITGKPGTEGSAAVAAGPGGSVADAAAQAGTDQAQTDAPKAASEAPSKPTGKEAGGWGIGTAVGSVIGSAAGMVGLKGATSSSEPEEQAAAAGTAEGTEGVTAPPDGREPTSAKRSLTQAAAAPVLAAPSTGAAEAASKEITPTDDREPLTSVKRSLTQAAAAPKLQQTPLEESTTAGDEATPAASPIPRSEALVKEAPGAPEGDLREPLSMVKRELTQAAAAPRIAEVIEEGPPAAADVQDGQTSLAEAASGTGAKGEPLLPEGQSYAALAGGVAVTAATGAVALAAGGAVAGLAAAGLAGGAVLNYLKPEEEAAESASQGSQQGVSNTKVGVNRDTDGQAPSSAGEPKEGIASSPTSAAAHTVFGAKYAEELGNLEPLSASQGAASSARAPALAAAAGVEPGSDAAGKTEEGGLGLSTKGAPGKDLDNLWDKAWAGDSAAPGSAAQGASSKAGNVPGGGLPTAEAGAQKPPSEDRRPALADKLLGSDISEGHASRSADLPAAERTPVSESSGGASETPVVLPSSISSPLAPASPAADRGAPGEPNEEHGFIESAAENAKKAAAAVGLGSLLPTIDSAKAGLKQAASPTTQMRAAESGSAPGKSGVRSLPAEGALAQGSVLSGGSPVEGSPFAGGLGASDGTLPTALLAGVGTSGPDGEKPSSDSLLSDEIAEPKEQAKAAKAVDFDTRVQSGLEDIEAESVDPSVVVKTEAPPTPTAAKAAAVDTPFSQDSPSLAAAQQTAGSAAPGVPEPAAAVEYQDKQASEGGSHGDMPGARTSVSPRPPRDPKLRDPSAEEAFKEAAKTPHSRTKSLNIATTGSDEFDAFIDKEARATRAQPQTHSAPPVLDPKAPNSNLAAVQGGVGIADKDESALGDLCSKDLKEEQSGSSPSAPAEDSTLTDPPSPVATALSIPKQGSQGAAKVQEEGTASKEKAVAAPGRADPRAEGSETGEKNGAPADAAAAEGLSPRNGAPYANGLPPPSKPQVGGSEISPEISPATPARAGAQAKTGQGASRSQEKKASSGFCCFCQSNTEE